MTRLAPAQPDPSVAAGGTALASIARGGMASILGSGVSAVCQLVVVLVVTRWYSPSDAGALFAATAAFFIVVAVVQLGTDQGLVLFVAAHLARGQTGDLRRILRIGLGPVLVAALLGTALLLALADPVGALLGDTAGSDRAAQMLRVLALAVPFAAVHEAVLAATRGLGSLRSTIIVERIVRPVLQPLLIIGVAVADLGTGALAPAWATPYALAALWSSLAMRRSLLRAEARPPAGVAHASQGDPAELDDAAPAAGRLRTEFWSFTAGRAVSRIFQVALQRIDVILLAAIAGTTAAAIYTAATRFIAVGMLANQAIQQVIQPRLAAMLARDQIALVEQVLRRTTVWLVVLVWPGYLALAVLAPTFMRIFGPGYDDGAPSLAILAIAMLAASAAGPLDVALLMAGRSAVSLVNMSVALAVDVTGCLLLVPPFGATGAAVAWAAAIVVRNALTIVQTRRLLAVTAASRALREVTLLGVGCCAAAPVALVLAGAGTVLVVAVVVGGLVAYVALTYRRRESLGLDTRLDEVPAAVRS